MELEYLPMRDRDLNVVEGFSRELIARYEDFQAFELSLDEIMAWQRRKLEKRRGEYARVTRDGETVAYIRCAFDSELPDTDRKGLELDDLYVLPQFRSQGIGEAVLRRCCTLTKGAVWFYVFSGNTRAIALYERLGFRVTRTISPTRCIMELLR